jgi:hypothetical protein
VAVVGVVADDDVVVVIPPLPECLEEDSFDPFQHRLLHLYKACCIVQEIGCGMSSMLIRNN